MAEIQIFLGPSSSQRSHGSGNFFGGGISTFFVGVAGQNVSLTPNLPRWTLNPHNFGQSGRNAFFFCPSPSHRGDGSRGGKVFTILTLFAHVAGRTVRLPSPKLPFWAFATAYLRPGRSKLDTVKGKKRVKQVYNSRFRAVTMSASPVPRMCTKVYLWLRVLGIRLSKG